LPLNSIVILHKAFILNFIFILYLLNIIHIVQKVVLIEWLPYLLLRFIRWTLLL